MKSEELMQGDLLFSLIDRNGFIEKKTVRVTGISDFPCIQTDESVIWHTIETYEPIPLTPEILEKNQFRKDDETDQWYFKSEDRLDLGLLAVGIDDGCGVGLCVMSNGAITYYCKYVHELQHYLRLIGGAEEIIL